MKLICGERTLDLSVPHIMGILNTTPDSFSDGGRFSHIDAALSHAEKMMMDGATIIDIGGESTRPGAVAVSLSEEMDRVLPVLEKVRANLDVCISVDTSSPELMTQAAGLGAHLLNDVRALKKDGAILAAKNTQLPVCLMHMQGQPETMQQKPSYESVLDEVSQFFTQRLLACEFAGLSRERILIDPGFGFGKSLSHNYQLLAHLEYFKSLNLPILVGLSRKSMIGGALQDRPVEERLVGSVTAALLAVMKGANIVRVHDVKETADALAVYQVMQQQK